MSRRWTAWGRAVGAIGLAALVAMLTTGSASVSAAGDPSGRLVYTGADGIYLLRMDGSAPQRIWKAPAGGQGVAPRWSDDGTRIAFEGPDGNVWVMNADGSSAHAVNNQAVAASGCSADSCTDPGTIADSVRWSHDGNSLSYRLVQGLARGSIWTVAADGSSEPRQVASADDLCLFNEGWSPDARPLFSRCATSSSPSNATYAAVGGQRPLVAGSQLAYSADGIRLSFSNHALNNGSMAVTLFIAAADGSGAQPIAGGGQNPVWSHNGLLAYQTAGDSGWVMHVYDPVTGKDSVVGPGVLAGWSPDGSYLYYTVIADDGTTTIWRVRPDGSDAAQIATGNFPDWTA